MLTTLAVLVDAQNVSHTLAAEIFRAVDGLGTTSLRRIYGDWSSPLSAGWQSRIDQYALRPMQQFGQVAGKNAADLALIIDAMDLLHSGRHAGFCIVSSDSDFTALAVRIRQEGIKVFGIGEAKALPGFRAACDEFLVLKKAASPSAAGKERPKPAVVAQAIRNDAKSVALPSKAPLSGADLDILRQAIMAQRGGDGWADVGVVGSYLAQAQFDIRKHAANLSKLLRVSSIAEVAEADAQAGKNLRVRLRATGQ